MKARQRGRLVTQRDITRICIAEQMLKNARDELRAAGAHNTCAKVRSAIKSCQGAYNNANAHLARQNRRQP